MSDVATPTPTASASEVNSGAEVSDTQATPAKASQAEAPKEPEFKPIKLKLKLDKREEEREFDQESLTRTVQKGLVADRRFEEAARKEQEVRKLANELQDKYSKLTDKQARKLALQELGVDPIQFAEELMQEYLEEQSLTAEQRRIKELEAFQKQKQREEEEYRRQIEQQQEMQAQQKYFKEIDDTITQVLQNEGIEKNLEVVERIIQYMRAAHRVGQDISVEEIVSKLKNDGTNFIKSFVQNKDVERLANLLGEDMLKEINNYYLKKRVGGKPPVQVVSRSQKQAQTVDPYLFFKNLGK